MLSAGEEEEEEEEEEGLYLQLETRGEKKEASCALERLHG
jgi:hypothetical protein